MSTIAKALLVAVTIVSVLYVRQGVLELAELKRFPQPIGFIRELTETEKAKVYLLEKVGYTDFRKLSAIATCESQWKLDAFNHSTKDGGAFQINKMHLPTAKAKGLQVWDKWKDNIDFAVELYRKNGTSDWSASKHCWYRKLSTAK